MGQQWHYKISFIVEQLFNKITLKTSEITIIIEITYIGNIIIIVSQELNTSFILNIFVIAMLTKAKSEDIYFAH